MCHNQLAFHSSLFVFSSVYRMIKLLKPSPSTEYVDLTIGFDGTEDDEDLPAPPVRYHIQ